MSVLAVPTGQVSKLRQREQSDLTEDTKDSEAAVRKLAGWVPTPGSSPLAVWPWASEVTSLCLCSLICDKGEMEVGPTVAKAHTDKTGDGLSSPPGSAWAPGPR